ncbi:PEP/pyruvate-binding domain-containing protein [Streptomyces sp. NPDC015492]|uniref:PEP/pyruvate-binding domain-containing protein n=1 Tax=Streptomyces sp. NPDC015492 TaxID=3364958 RepID=UPI0036F8DC7C
MESVRHVVPFTELGRRDVGRVGGENASLGELTNRLADAGVRVPPGFATAEAYGELLETDGLPDLVRRQIDRLHEGARLDEVGAAVRSLFLARPLPAPVVVRTSDFKTKECAKLLGGRPYEPDEANLMIGWRGASRYYSEAYREGFALECRALRRVRDMMGLTTSSSWSPSAAPSTRPTGCSR